MSDLDGTIALVRSPLTGSERVIIPAGGEDDAEAIAFNGKFDARLVLDEPARIHHWEDYETFAEAKIAALLLSERAQIQRPAAGPPPGTRNVGKWYADRQAALVAASDARSRFKIQRIEEDRGWGVTGRMRPAHFDRSKILSIGIDAVPTGDPTIANPDWTPAPLADREIVHIERRPKARAAEKPPKWFKGPEKIPHQYAIYQYGAAIYVENVAGLTETEREDEAEEAAGDMTAAEWAQRPQWTVAECRVASAQRALVNEEHKRCVERFATGRRYCEPPDDADQRVFIDAVWVPTHVRAPKKIENYIGKGGCYTGPETAGTWWFSVGLPNELPKTKPEAPQLSLFAGVA